MRTRPQNKINHVVLVLDESWSMKKHRTALLKIVKNQIARLARRSQDLNMETRVSIYTFADTAQNLVYDMDVLRLPSIDDLYYPDGRTALIDATFLSLDELAQTAQLHGDHAFLEIVLSDGGENQSRRRPQDLRAKLASLPKHWSVACLVPDQLCKDNAQAYGFPASNIAIWDADSAAGLEEAGATIDQGIETFLANRVKGVHTTSVFSTGVEAVNATTVQATLTPLAAGAYEVIPVGADAYIELFVRSTGRQLVRGNAYYQLTKTETIQRTKQVVVREEATGRFFTGQQARQLIGLPDVDVRVKPDHNPDYKIFVQSTSTNRKLIKGTDLLLMR
jgi:hypothetical protein